MAPWIRNGGSYPFTMTGYAYMTASQKRDTIYISVTNDLGRRTPEHRSGQGSRFTSRYGSSFFAEPGGRRSVLSRCILRLMSRNGSQGLRASLRSLLALG